MSTAMQPEPLSGDGSGGRLMRFTLRVVAATLVITGLIAWLLVSHTPTRVAGAPGHTITHSSSTTLFYHATNQMSFRRGGDGVYRVEAQVNEAQVRFVVDPGVSTVMLSLEDARAAGIDTAKLSFSARAATPQGEMSVASVTIPMLSLKQLTLFNVGGVVAQGHMPSSILGSTFLKRFDSYDVGETELVLRW
jgi:clan AA aspartic protease (TIGR02281 family)